MSSGMPLARATLAVRLALSGMTRATYQFVFSTAPGHECSHSIRPTLNLASIRNRTIRLMFPSQNDPRDRSVAYSVDALNYVREFQLGEV